MEQPKPLNVVGPQIQRLREAAGLTQEQLAAKCQVMGLDITRGTLAKIESRVRAAFDHELPFLAESLGVPLTSLFPGKRVVIHRKARNPHGTRRPKKREIERAKR